MKIDEYYQVVWTVTDGTMHHTTRMKFTNETEAVQYARDLRNAEPPIYVECIEHHIVSNIAFLDPSEIHDEDKVINEKNKFTFVKGLRVRMITSAKYRDKYGTVVDILKNNADDTMIMVRWDGMEKGGRWHHPNKLEAVDYEKEAWEGSK